MKNFVKDNWFKLGILILALVLVIYLIYYFSFLLPKPTEQKDISEYMNNRKDIVSVEKVENVPQKPTVTKNEVKKDSFIPDLPVKLNCQQVGEQMYQNLVISLGKILVFNPSYSYNSRLNTCLYAGGFFGSQKADYMEMFVKDSLTNKYILSYIAQKDSSGNLVRIDAISNTASVADFEAQKQVLMNE